MRLWARRPKAPLHVTDVKKKNLIEFFFVYVLYVWIWDAEASLPRWLIWQDQVSNRILVIIFNLRHDINLIFNGFTN